LYINNFVECKIFLLHKTEISMPIALLVSLILFSISRSDEPFSWTILNYWPYIFKLFYSWNYIPIDLQFLWMICS
jgi:hypothetical protein